MPPETQRETVTGTLLTTGRGFYMELPEKGGVVGVDTAQVAHSAFKITELHEIGSTAMDKFREKIRAFVGKEVTAQIEQDPGKDRGRWRIVDIHVQP